MITGLTYTTHTIHGHGDLICSPNAQIKTSLVTRNTHASVKAFFDRIGPQWQSLFDPVLTREFPFVKPDKRLLLHVAKVRNIATVTFG
jgi:phosphoglycolate phosphatase-like HAD superfamily hydrolase